jgi:hypothetical protein
MVQPQLDPSQRHVQLPSGEKELRQVNLCGSPSLGTLNNSAHRTKMFTDLLLTCCHCHVFIICVNWIYWDELILAEPNSTNLEGAMVEVMVGSLKIRKSNKFQFYWPYRKSQPGLYGFDLTRLYFTWVSWANGFSEQENEGCELKQSKVRISQPALWAIGWFHKAST